MDEKYIQDLYDHLGGQSKFGKFDDFKHLMQNDDKYRKDFHDAFGEKELGAYQDFDVLVKKKSGGDNAVIPSDKNLSSGEQGLPVTPKGEAEIPTVDLNDNETANSIDLAAQHSELKNKTISIGITGEDSYEQPDIEAQKKGKDIKEFLDINRGVNVEDLHNETKDLTPNDYGREGFDKNTLLADREENNPLYHRKLARLKWEAPIKSILDESLVSGNLTKEGYDQINNSIKSSLTALNDKTGNYDQQRRRVNDIANVIKSYGGVDQDKILSQYAVEVGKIYGNSYKNPTAETSTESKYLTPNAELGYQYLKDVSPDKAGQYERLFIDPKSIKGKPDEEKGYNHLMQTLEETGIGLQENAVNEDLNNLSRIAKKNGGLSPGQIAEAEKLEAKSNELQKAKTELDTKYPDRIENKVDDAMQEILGQRITGLNYAGGVAGKAFKNTGEGIWEAVSSPFMSDESNKQRELAIMGESLEDESIYHKTDANKGLQTDKLVINPELQKQIDEIKNDKSLTQGQKESKLYPLLKDNTDKFSRIPIQGGQLNISPSSIMYGVTDMAASLLPFIALEAATGGGATAGVARKLLATFTSAAATTFHDEYANAIMSGKPQSEAYKSAMINTAISSAAMSGAGTAEKVKAFFKESKSSAADLIKGLSEEAIADVLAKGTPKGMKGIAQAIKDRVKATPAMLAKGAKTGAEFEVAMTAANELKGQINNTPMDREQNFKQSLLNIASFSGLGLLQHSGYKSPTELQKSTITKFGEKPDDFIGVADQMKKDGQLTPAEYDHRIELINKSADAYKSLPKSNSKGKPLTEKEKGDYLYETVIKNDNTKGKADLPPKQAAEAEHNAMVADFKREQILNPSTDKQLEQRVKTIEKMLTPNKDGSGDIIEIPEKQRKLYEAELDAVKQTIEKRKNEVPEPENISQPIDLSIDTESKAPTVSSEVKADVVGSEAEVKKLETERDAEIEKVVKPDLKLELISSKDLVDSKDPVGNKEKHDIIKEKYKALKRLLDCL